MELEHELFVCGTHALAFYLSPRAKRLDKAFEARVSRGLPAGQLPNFISYAVQPLSRPAACAMPLHSCTPVVSNAEARELRAFFGSTLPLNVMVPAKGERRNSSRMCCWIHPAAVPRENYLHLAKGLFIASPELAAMQVCPFYSEVDAIVLMSMLCSFYVENPQVAGGLEPRRAPCTPESFGIFLAQMRARRLKERDARTLEEILAASVAGKLARAGVIGVALVFHRYALVRPVKVWAQHCAFLGLDRAVEHGFRKRKPAKSLWKRECQRKLQFCWRSRVGDSGSQAPH